MTTTADPHYSARMDVLRLPYKQTYLIGEQLDLSGMLVDIYHVDSEGSFLKYRNDDVAKHLDRYDVEGYDNTTPGTKVILIRYKSFNRALNEWVYAYTNVIVMVNEPVTTSLPPAPSHGLL